MSTPPSTSRTIPAQKGNSRMARTTTLTLASLATMALALTGCAPSEKESEGADGGAVKVGMITSLTGPLAAYGEAYRAGFEVGLDQATDGTGEVGGTEIDIEWVDDAGLPDTAVTKARDLIGQGTKVIGGTVVSGIATALAEQAEQNKVLYLSGPAASDALTGVNEHTFRSGRQTYQDVAAAGTILGDKVDGAKVVVFAQDNAFGQGNAAAVETVLGGLGAEVTPILVAEDATEFTPFAIRIKQTAPDMVFVAWAGATSTAMWEALAQQQVLGSTQVVTGLGDVATYQAYGPASDKITFLNHYFAGAAGTDDEKKLLDGLAEEGEEADLFSPDGYVAAQMLVHALEEGDGDVDAMIDALEGWSFESIKGELAVREEDHALIQPMYQVKLVHKDDTWAPALVETIPADAVAPPVK